MSKSFGSVFIWSALQTVVRLVVGFLSIKVTAVYAGNYTDTMTKAMTAMKGGQPPQLSVLLSTDVFTLIDENAIP